MSTCILKCYIYLKQSSVYTIYIIFTTSDVIFLQLFRRVGTFLFFFVFSEGRREGERERNGCVRDVASSHSRLACSPGMCPAWDLNQSPFSSQACAQSTEPHQPAPFQKEVMGVSPVSETRWMTIKCSCQGSFCAF